MFQLRGFIFFFIAILLVFISIRSSYPPAVKSGQVPDSAFSVTRAFIHLEKISNLPHSTGTLQQQKVREYIINTCRQYGFTVEIQQTTAINNRRNFLQAGRISNIIARKKGKHPGKTVVLMAHYDSEPNTGGAGDNGAGVASMLETARALQKSAPLHNELLLLFTDGEEIGLLGARAFVEEYKNIKDIGLVINFEGRGNAGPSSMFEVNVNNGWAIDQYAKSAAHPFANSLGYEIYKNLPNSTDYTIFKNAGITGLNNAFIDGVSNYHSLNDRPANLDKRSFQHHGENMLSLARHFGNLEIIHTKAPDKSYFNVFGYWLLHYPASWNLVFVIVVNLLFIGYLFVGVKNRKVSIGGLVISTVIFPLLLTVIYFLARFLLKAVLSYYRLFARFEENNSYNGKWYFFAFSALAVSLITLAYWLISKRIRRAVLYAGILMVLVVLMNLMQYGVPSASYLLFVPLIFIIPVQLYLLKSRQPVNEAIGLDVLTLVSLTPSICILSVMIYFAYVAFALGPNLPLIVVAAGLMTAILLPVMFSTFTLKKPWIAMGGIILFLIGLVGAHFNSKYTRREPLPSSLYYTLDADSSRAKWRSDFKEPDKFTSTFFNSDPGGSGTGTRQLSAEAPLLNLQPPRAKIVADTMLGNDIRKLEILVQPGRANVNQVTIEIPDGSNVISCALNGKSPGQLISELRYISFSGVTDSGFQVQLEVAPVKKLNLVISDVSQGLPMINIPVSYPEGIIPAQGRSNTTRVSKHYRF